MPNINEAKIYVGLLKVWEKKLRVGMHMTKRQKEAMVKALIRQLEYLGCDVESEEE